MCGMLLLTRVKGSAFAIFLFVFDNYYLFFVMLMMLMMMLLLSSSFCMVYVDISYGDGASF